MPAIQSVDELLGQIQSGRAFDYLYFWGHSSRPGIITKSCFSQWYPTPFEVEGRSYSTAEHYMMAQKALLFNDQEAERQILAANSPGAAKALGRKILNFDEDVWLRHRFDIVVRGNLAKFSQHALLREFLERTGERVLVEASPQDRIWGIGLAEDHPDAADPQRWQGTNLLGFALMVVREQLSKR